MVVAALAAPEVVLLASSEAVKGVRVDSAALEAREAPRLANSMVQEAPEVLQANSAATQEAPDDSTAQEALEVREDHLANSEVAREVRQEDLANSAPAALAGSTVLLVLAALAALNEGLRASLAMVALLQVVLVDSMAPEVHEALRSMALLAALDDSMALVQAVREVLLVRSAAHREAHVDSMAQAPTAQEEVLRSTTAGRLGPEFYVAVAAAVLPVAAVSVMEVLDRWAQDDAAAVEARHAEERLRLITSEGQAR